jgi:sec-independent protein translocase protein TatB
MVAPPQIELGILGWTDSLLLMVLALVVFGPRRLPQIGRQIGKLMYEFRKASNDFKFQMEEEMRSAEEADRRKKEEERLKALAAQTPPAELTPPPPASTESPYNEGAVYPPASPPAETATTAPSETPADETYPQIHPPSTGEPVAGSRPHRSRGEVGVDSAPATDNGAASPAEGSGEIASATDAGHETVAAQAEKSQPVTEQTAHHG